MEIIGAAALMEVGSVIGAVVYGRMHGARAAAAKNIAPPPAPVEPAATPARAAEAARRDDALAVREAELERDREHLTLEREELKRRLEQLSGLSAARAKQILLRESQDDAMHHAAKRLRQIEEETKRDPARRVRHFLSACMH